MAARQVVAQISGAQPDLFPNGFHTLRGSENTLALSAHFLMEAPRFCATNNLQRRAVYCSPQGGWRESYEGANGKIGAGSAERGVREKDLARAKPETVS